MPNLSIYSKDIRLLDGLYSLNDLHKAAGGNSKHKPNNFLRVEQTKELVTEIEQVSDMRLALKTVHGGTSRGTYACKELVYAYAMWISAKFHLLVIRAFDESQKQYQMIEPKRPQVTDTERYTLANTIIRELKMDGNPVLVPYIELANIVGLMRHYQQTIAQLSEMHSRVEDGIATFKKAGGLHFGDS